MVKHVILWTLKNEYSKEEKEAIKAEIKAGLEGLAGQIPGLLEIHVNINGLESSNRSEERRVGKECRSRWSPYH